LADLQLAEQQQDDQHDQDDAAEPHSGMAHAIAVPAEPATEAAQQINDDEDDEDRSQRHRALPTGAGRQAYAAPRLLGKAYSVGWSMIRSSGRRSRYLGCNFSAAELMQ
jgi:hypothetical protein